MARREIRSRFSWTGRLAWAVVGLGLPASLMPLRSWGQSEAPQLLSTTGGNGRQPWKNLTELRKAAAAGNPAACLQLGLRFETGNELKQDYGERRVRDQLSSQPQVIAAAEQRAKELGREVAARKGTKPPWPPPAFSPPAPPATTKS